MEAGERMFRVREWLTGMSKGSGEAPSDKMCCGFLDAPVSRYCDLGTPHLGYEKSCFAVASRRSIPYKELSFDHLKLSFGRASSTVSGDLLVQFQTQKEKRSK